MIRPRGYQAAQYFTLNILHPYRNQSTQSESYFNNSWNVSLVIQEKRTVIHDLFSFSDNSLSYKSRNLIAIHVRSCNRACGRLDYINKFFGSFLNFLWASTLILKKYHILPYFNKNRCCFFYVWFSLLVLTRVIGRGSNASDICQWSTKQNFQTLQQIISHRQTDQFICWFLLKNVKFSCYFLTMQKLSMDEKVPTWRKTNFPPS